MVERDGKTFCSNQCAGIKDLKAAERLENKFNLVRFLFTFKGRASRAQFFIFFGVLLTAVFGCAFLETFMDPEGSPFWVYFLIFFLLWPYSAVLTKRLHDRGRSGYWILACLVPVLGVIVKIWILAETFFPGEAFPNDFGKNLDFHKRK